MNSEKMLSECGSIFFFFSFKSRKNISERKMGRHLKAAQVHDPNLSHSEVASAMAFNDAQKIHSWGPV